jgi:hypothetical protein
VLFVLEELTLVLGPEMVLVHVEIFVVYQDFGYLGLSVELDVV